MFKYDPSGQGHPNFSIDISQYIPNIIIIDEIKHELSIGNEVHIISRNPRDKKLFLINHGLEYLADNYDKYVHISKGNKSDEIIKYGIAEFTEDSVNELQKIHSVLPDVKLYLMTTIKTYRNPSIEPVKEVYDPYLKSKRITGSGIFLIITSTKYPASILLIQERNGKYCDPGGRIDSGYTSEKSAIKELREETYNTFYLNESNLSDKITIGEYDCFFININDNEYEKNYFNNKKILSKKKIPSSWRETQSIGRFNLNNLIQSIKTNNKKVKGRIRGKEIDCTICNRTFYALNAYFNTKSKTLNEEEILRNLPKQLILKSKKSQGRDLIFTENTIYYYN